MHYFDYFLLLVYNINNTNSFCIGVRRQRNAEIETKAKELDPLLETAAVIHRRVKAMLDEDPDKYDFLLDGAIRHAAVFAALRKKI